MLVWLGDLNYRINSTYEHAKELAHRNQLSELLAKVQLDLQCPTVLLLKFFRLVLRSNSMGFSFMAV